MSFSRSTTSSATRRSAAWSSSYYLPRRGLFIFIGESAMIITLIFIITSVVAVAVTFYRGIFD